MMLEVLISDLFVVLCRLWAILFVFDLAGLRLWLMHVDLQIVV